MSSFNIDDFMYSEQSGGLSTRINPVPAGEYVGSISAVNGRTQGEYAILEVSWEINDPSFQELIGLNPATVRQSIFLDLTANGQFDSSEGKNIQLGRLLEALGMNAGTWSPSTLPGRSAHVKVEHKAGKNGGDVFANVTRVAKID